MISSRYLTKLMNKLSILDKAYAHCDIPCGIYDPNDAIQAAQTCIRMTELILEKQNDDRFTLLLNENNLGYTNTLKRLIKESKTDIVCILDPDGN